MAVTRTLIATIEIACCRDGEEVYHPLPRQILAPQTKPYFDEPLSSWEERARQALNTKYRALADNECRGMGTPRLCVFNLRVDDVIETGIPEGLPIPRIVVNLYKELKAEIERERRRIESNTDEIADILATPRDKLTSSQRAEIQRLDNEIRRSNEIIRDNESEMRNIERQYPDIRSE